MLRHYRGRLYFMPYCASWGPLLCVTARRVFKLLRRLAKPHMQSTLQAIIGKPSCHSCHCDLEEHMSCLNHICVCVCVVCVCVFRKVRIRSAEALRHLGASILWGVLLFWDNLHTLLGRFCLVGRFTVSSGWHHIPENCFIGTRLLENDKYYTIPNIWLCNYYTTRNSDMQR